MLLAYQTQAGFFVKQQQELKLDPSLIIANTPVNNREFFDTAEESSEGVVVTYIDSNKEHPAAAIVRSGCGSEVNFFSSNGYDSIVIAYRALRARIHRNTLGNLPGVVPETELTEERRLVREAWQALMCEGDS